MHEILPELKAQLAWTECGIDTICLFDETHDSYTDDANILLEDVIRGVFPNIGFHIDSPYGVFISIKEAKKIKELLKY